MTAGRIVRRLLVALLVAAVVVTCLRLGWWQWQRFGLTGSAQNLGYTLQWPVFAAFAIFMWWRLSQLEARRREERAEAATPTEQENGPSPDPDARAAVESAAEPASTETAARPAEPASSTATAAGPVAVPPDQTDDPDDELAAYNRYLAQLHVKESDRAR